MATDPSDAVWTRPKASDIPKGWMIPEEEAFTSRKRIGEQIPDDAREFWERAQFGYGPDGERVFFGSILNYAYSLCDRIAAGVEPEESILVGSASLPKDVAIVRILTGHFVGGGMLGPPRIALLHYYPEKSVAEVLAGIHYVRVRVVTE